VDVAQHLLHGGGVEAGLVQQEHGLAAEFAGDCLADGGSGSLQDFQLVGGEKVALPGQQQVGFGQRSEAGSGGGGVSFSLGRLVVRVGSAGFSQGSRDVAEVAVEDFGEEAVQVGEVSSDMAGGSADGEGEGGHGHGVAAVDGHEALAEIHDPGSLLVLLFGEAVPSLVDPGDAVS